MNSRETAYAYQFFFFREFIIKESLMARPETCEQKIE